MRKTICILPQKIGRGGPGSFHTRFAEVLSSRGYNLNHDALDPANTAILVIGGTRHIGLLREANRNGVRIVQRLNGMNWVHRQTRTGIKSFIKVISHRDGGRVNTEKQKIPAALSITASILIYSTRLVRVLRLLIASASCSLKATSVADMKAVWILQCRWPSCSPSG